MDSISTADVARKQKLLIFAILGQVLNLVVTVVRNLSGGQPVVDGEVQVTWFDVMMIPVQLGIAIFTIVAVILLMAALKRPVVSMVLAAIAMFIPLVGLIVLLCVNARATRVLREAGYAIGLMGARTAT